MLVWFFYFGAMFAFFLTPLVNVAMHHMDLMDVFNVAFLIGGCLYWWPMVGLDPNLHWRMGYGARIANLALGVPFEAFLGVVILSTGKPDCLHVLRSRARTPVEDCSGRRPSSPPLRV